MFLHFIPARDLANLHHGTYKDVISRVRWLETRFPAYRQIPVSGDDPVVVDSALTGGVRLEGALVEYSYYPRIVGHLKRLAPQACVAVRAINLEPLQFLGNHGWFPERGPLWMLFGMGRLLSQDIRVKRTADVILSINEWENRKYWNWLPGKASVEWLPYRCPEHLLPPHPLPYGQRRIIACMPTSHENRKSRDLVIRFQDFATAMKRSGSRDAFVVTGSLETWTLPSCAAVTYSGFIGNPADFMGTCRAVALLSPLGYGVKTTAADALAAGAHVLAHPDLVRRSPAAVRPFLLPLDSNRPLDAAAVARTLEEPPQGMALHQELCAESARVLRRWFGGGEQ